MSEDFRVNHRYKKSVKLFAQAQTVLPGGVNSPARAFKSVGTTPIMVEKAQGPYLTDVDANHYVDLVCSWGPAILGHAHPRVERAVRESAERGLSFGAPHVTETQLAKKIIERLSLTLNGDQGTFTIQGAEKVRFVSTGTEATMTAIRLARGYTKRPYILKFTGNYHGHSDSLLVSAGSAATTLAVPDSAGVTASTAGDTIVVEYNNPEVVKEAFEKYGDQIAAVIAEAAPANMGVVTPQPEFNKFLSDITQKHGSLFILDEVLTGFRVSSAGYWGYELKQTIQDEDGGEKDVWAPDIFTFGKVIGGGLPVAALAGKSELMDHLAPDGPVYQAGTLSGNPVAVAAGLATLDLASDEVYETLDARSEQLQTVVSHVLNEAGVSHTIQTAGNLFSVAFGNHTEIKNYADAKNQELYRFVPFFRSLLDQGVYIPPSAFEAWFISSAHDDAAMDKIFAALPAAATAAAQAKQ